jgi:hypothetical protein
LGISKEVITPPEITLTSKKPIMIEDLKKLLPREKTTTDIGKIAEVDPDSISMFVREFSGYNQALAEVTASLPLLVEHIYADLREKVESLETCGDYGEDLAKFEVLKLLTPNKE